MRGSMSRRDAYEKGALSLRGSGGRARARSVGVEWEGEGMPWGAPYSHPPSPHPPHSLPPLSHADSDLLSHTHPSLSYSPRIATRASHSPRIAPRASHSLHRPPCSLCDSRKLRLDKRSGRIDYLLHN